LVASVSLDLGFWDPSSEIHIYWLN